MTRRNPAKQAGQAILERMCPLFKGRIDPHQQDAEQEIDLPVSGRTNFGSS